MRCNFKFLLYTLHVLAIFEFKSSESVNIFFYHLLASYSHRIAVWPLVEALAARGHNVTFLHSYPPKVPSEAVNEFYPKALGNIWAHTKPDGTVTQDNGFLNVRVTEGPVSVYFGNFGFTYRALDLCDKILSEPEMDTFVKSNNFDLVVIDSVFNECGYGLAHKWGAKTIIYFSTVPSGVWGIESNGFLGTAEPWIADQIMPYPMPMTFFNRVRTMLWAAGLTLVKEWIYYPRLENLWREKLNLTADTPPLSSMLQETSLILYNSHFSEEEARSLPPKFVSVPALHAWDNNVKPLPKDISKFIDGSGQEGFIYVSFGGEANFTDTPIEFQNIFTQVFTQMRDVRFLWKRSKEGAAEMPKNVLIRDWMPQTDILASPKCRGFITHGGILGIQEAIMAGVPMIAMPIFAEQEYNAYRLQRTGRGIKLEIHGLMQNDLSSAIAELLRNKSYKTEILKARSQLRDQQNKPLDTAVFWTEYVLRNDMSSLQPLSTRHFYWFQTNFLDVWAFIAVCALILSAMMLYVSRVVVVVLTSRFSTVEKVKKN